MLSVHLGKGVAWLCEEVWGEGGMRVNAREKQEDREACKC